MSNLAMMMGLGSGAGGPSKPTEIGQEYGGGYYAGNIIISSTEYYLIVAPKATGESTYQWKTFISASGATSTFNGASNTSKMVSLGSHPAASFCAGLTIGDYTDWYMPSRYEMEICYYNLKPTADFNNGSWGINPYAVPPRTSNYDTYIPTQTSVTLFQAGNSEAFETVFPFYWVSTESSAASSEYFLMGEGQVGNIDKNYTKYVRAVRKEAVED
jgi:hypothetical protein